MGKSTQTDPFAAQAAAARAALVRSIATGGALSDPAWLRAFEEVPRHLFVPYYFSSAGYGYQRLWREDAEPERRWRWLAGIYADTPLATRVRDGELISSSSQPSLMALMLEALDVRDGHRVLEIGAGTGYNAALLSHRLGEANVTTVDLDPEITESARRHLAEAGYRPAVVTGDGARGCAARAPYDRIIATCALHTVPGAWLEQCAPEALILTPFATGLLRLRVGRDAGIAEGHFLQTPAFFVPLRGGAERPYPETGRLPRRAMRSDSFRFLLSLTEGALEPHEAFEVWARAGHPQRERYGVSMRGGRQWAWLDDPGGADRWEIG